MVTHGYLLNLFTISTQGKMANLFLYLLVPFSPVPWVTASGAAAWPHVCAPCAASSANKRMETLLWRHRVCFQRRCRACLLLLLSQGSSSQQGRVVLGVRVLGAGLASPAALLLRGSASRGAVQGFLLLPRCSCGCASLPGPQSAQQQQKSWRVVQGLFAECLAWFQEPVEGCGGA